MTKALELALESGSSGFTGQRNMIVNPGMRVGQQFGTTATTVSGTYSCDQWQYVGITSGTASSAIVLLPTPGGSGSRLRSTVTVADAALAAGDVVLMNQPVEGYATANLKWGTSAAKPIAIRFGCRASVAGTYHVSVRSTDALRSYVSPFTISSGEVNTDVVRTVIIPGDTSGTYAVYNTSSILVTVCYMSGTTYQAPSTNTWVAGNFVGASAQLNMLATNGATFDLFDVGMYEGEVVPAFTLPSYEEDIAACQRYYIVLPAVMCTGYGGAGQSVYETFTIPDQRIVPSVTFGTASFSNASTWAFNTASVNSVRVAVNITALGVGWGINDVYVSARM